MQELIWMIEPLVEVELKRANSIHEPAFNSMHEAYAVLIEELEEAHDEYEGCSRFVDMAWERIKADDKPDEWLAKAEKAAIRAAAEMIQTAAMCRKARM